MTLPEDDERTVIKGGPGPSGPPRRDLFGEFADALPASTRLLEFEILSVIGQGGFGIVYLAHDLSLDRRVAIKEYMPSALATRTRSMTVSVRSGRHAETFAAGLRSFINEARLLAQFDHPSLLKVYRFWEAHGTAYMVMPYYLGTTLGKMLPQLGGPPSETWLKALLHPLLDALELMHAARCFHRDIAPDNILILPDGRPLLLDFGAARRVIGDMTQALTVILKTGYAPVEQYGAMPNMSQGAWTDLYALGSVVEFAITGHTPPQAVTRFLADKREPLAVAAAGRYSDNFLKAIDRSLAVLPKDRPQSVAEMRVLIGARPSGFPHASAGAMGLPAAAAAPAATRSPGALERTLQKLRRGEPNAATVRYTAPPSIEPATPTAGATKAVAPGAAPRPSHRVIMLSGVAVLLVLAAAAAGYAWFDEGRQDVLDPAASATRTTPLPAPVAASGDKTTTPALAPAAIETPTPVGAPAPAQPMPRPQPDTDAEPAAATTPATTAPIPASAPAAAADVPRTAARAAPRAPRAPAPEVGATQRIPNKNLPNPRCADIIQRTSLGEEPSDADKALLKRECRP